MSDHHEASAIDEATAHVHFAKACFNAAWVLIEKPNRSEADDEAMIQLNQASLWHWSQRPDCTDRHRSVGYWQASRIRTLLGHRGEALRYAALCLAHSRALPPFYQAYAHEALARATDDTATRDAEAMQARVLAQGIADDDERALLLSDLATLATR